MSKISIKPFDFLKKYSALEHIWLKELSHLADYQRSPNTRGNRCDRTPHQVVTATSLILTQQGLEKYVKNKAAKFFAHCYRYLVVAQSTFDVPKSLLDKHFVAILPL